MTSINFTQARDNMVLQQAHAWGVFDEQILAVLGSLPREEFVPEKYRQVAYADLAIPLEHGQHMLCPKEEARILQELAIQPDDVVLEIGTGSGYHTALMASLAKHVYSIDIIPDFTQQAQQKLSHFGLNNVTLVTADAAMGWGESAPYDVIAVTGSLPLLPRNFGNDLSAGGRLFAIVGKKPAMTATLVTRDNNNSWQQKTLFETETLALLNAKEPEQFVF